LPISMVSDEEMFDRIRSGCVEKRLHLQMTQAELASRAGLSLPMIKNFERGRHVNAMSLIRILRAIGEFQRLEALVPEVLPSPMALFNQTQTAHRKKRVRRAKS